MWSFYRASLQLVSPKVKNPKMSEKKTQTEGHLDGSVGNTYDSWSQDHEFEPHVGYKAYLKKQTNKQKNNNKKTPTTQVES